VKAYLEAVKQAKEDHSAFLTAVDKWIEKHAAGAGTGRNRLSLKEKEELAKVKTSLTVSTGSGVKIHKPKRQFVAVECWDEGAYGALDTSKVVEQRIGGKVVRGVFRQVGKKGHFDVDEYDKNESLETTLESQLIFFGVYIFSC
jgi:hypothetical protein